MAQLTLSADEIFDLKVIAENSEDAYYAHGSFYQRLQNLGLVYAQQLTSGNYCYFLTDKGKKYLFSVQN